MKKFCYSYPRPSVTVDLAIFKKSQAFLPHTILLIKRGRDPYKGYWALPGGFVDHNEDLEHAARRELKEETNMDVGNLYQIGAFGKPGRDPRGHTITVAYYGIIDKDDTNESSQLQAGDDATEAEWFPINDLPKLAFDHHLIIKQAKTMAFSF